MTRLLRKLASFLLLALQALILQPIRRIKNLGRSSEERFLDAYLKDSLLPLTELEKQRRERFSACIHCGLCDVSCSAIAEATRFKIPSLSAFPIGYSRSMPIYHFTHQAIQAINQCNDCVECELSCPMGVPLNEIIEDMREHLARMEELGLVGVGES